METTLPFTVFNKIDQKAFRKYAFKTYLGNYRASFLGLIGLFLLYNGIKDVYRIENGVHTIGNYNFFIGIVLILNVVYYALSESKTISRLPYLNEGENYQFDEEGIFIESDYRKLFYPWNKLFSYSETKDFLILHANTIHGVYLQKNLYTTGQLDFLKNKIGVVFNKSGHSNYNK